MHIASFSVLSNRFVTRSFYSTPFCKVTTFPTSSHLLKGQVVSFFFFFNKV